VVVLTAGLVAVMSLITGCSGSKCESVCADANACAITERSTDVDCPEFCNDVEEFDKRTVAAGLASCQTQFDAHLACWEQNSAQMCNKDFEGCEEAGAAWTECMAAYCVSVAEQEGKTDPNCFGEDPALYPFDPF
jgi:hypothetical protein